MKECGPCSLLLLLTLTSFTQKTLSHQHCIMNICLEQSPMQSYIIKHTHIFEISPQAILMSVCVCVCVCARARVYVCVCVILCCVALCCILLSVCLLLLCFVLGYLLQSGETARKRVHYYEVIEFNSKGNNSPSSLMTILTTLSTN